MTTPKPPIGRPPGTPNKITRSVKDTILEVFAGMGGKKAMIEWGLENKTEFYRIYSKLLPTEVKADITVNLAIGVLLDEAQAREKLLTRIAEDMPLIEQNVSQPEQSLPQTCVNPTVEAIETDKPLK